MENKSMTPPSPTSSPVPPIATSTPEIDLNPISLLKKSWGLYKQRWTTYLGVQAVFFVVTIVLGIMLLGGSVAAIGVAATGEYQKLLPMLPGAILGVGIAMIVYILGLSLSQLALMLAVIGADQKLGAVDAYKQAVKKVIPFNIFTLVMGIIVTGAYLLFFIPGVLFSIWFSQAIFVYLTENAGSMGSLMKSRAYMKGHVMEVFVAFVMFFLVFMLINILIGVLPSILGDDNQFSYLLNLLSIPLSIILYPLQYIYLFLIFKELKRVYPAGQSSSSAAPVTPLPSKTPYIIVSALGYLLFLSIIWFTAATLIPRVAEFMQNRYSSPDEVTYEDNVVDETVLSESKVDDVKRRADIVLLMNGIEAYRADNEGNVPKHITTIPTYITSGLDLCSALVPTYMKSLPIDPYFQTEDDKEVTDCSKQYDLGYWISVGKNKNGGQSVTITAPVAASQEISLTR